MEKLKQTLAYIVLLLLTVITGSWGITYIVKHSMDVPQKEAVSEGIEKCNKAGGRYYIDYSELWGYTPYCFEPFFETELNDIVEDLRPDYYKK
jgi:hypothetical protein